jgi:DNA (cytosine-5)-methyltransferase 1
VAELYAACVECGNDDPTEGYLVCSDCLESLSSGGRVLDLFAGPGGWDEALRLIGVEGIVGVELDPDACETARAAGFERHQSDIRTVNPSTYRGIVGLVASPPCQTFSRSGKQQGTDDLDDLAAAVAATLRGYTATPETADARSNLVLEPARFIAELRPRWIAFEEVREVLPVWEAYAEELQGLGYSSWAGILNAADFGVPQSRKRAFMLASLDGPVLPPTPTHARYADQGLWDARQTWVTMADALGWSEADAIAANRAAPEASRPWSRCLSRHGRRSHEDPRHLHV